MAADRRVVVTGAASDHPISPRCPESSYLKAVWMRIG